MDKFNYDHIPNNVKDLIEERVYRNTPLKVIAKQFHIQVPEVRELIRKHDDYVSHVTAERRMMAKAKYQKMDKLAYRTLKAILETPHEIDVFTRSGDEVLKVGTKIDAQLLKVKKEVAEQILENTGAKDKIEKSGGINIDNRSITTTKQLPLKSDKEVIDDQRKEEVVGLLSQCTYDVDPEKIDAKYSR